MPPSVESLYKVPFLLLYVVLQCCLVWLWNGLPPVCCSLEYRFHGSRSLSFWLASIPACPWRVQPCNGTYLSDVYPKATPPPCQSTQIVQWLQTPEAEGHMRVRGDMKNAITWHLTPEVPPRQNQEGLKIQHLTKSTLVSSLSLTWENPNSFL